MLRWPHGRLPPLADSRALDVILLISINGPTWIRTYSRQPHRGLETVRPDEAQHNSLYSESDACAVRDFTVMS